MIASILSILQFLAISIIAASCGQAMMEKPQAPLIVPKDVAAPLPVKCMDKREPKSVLPDFSQIPQDDYEAAGRAGRATIDLLKSDLAAAEAQIKACTGE